MNIYIRDEGIKKKEIVKRQKMVNVIAAQSWNILFWKM